MRIILVHGFNANPNMNFHPWLKRGLQDLGYKVTAPEFPLTPLPKSENIDPEEVVEGIDMVGIIEKMKSEIGLLKNDDILLGHSLGALVILQYLEVVEMVETPRAVILVGAPWKVSKPELRRLFVDDLDAEVLMWKAREFIVIHSKDDRLVPFEHGKKLAEQLKAKLIETESDDHYMGEKYPILLETILNIAKTPFEFAPGMSLEDELREIK